MYAIIISPASIILVHIFFLCLIYMLSLYYCKSYVCLILINSIYFYNKLYIFILIVYCIFYYYYCCYYLHLFLFSHKMYSFLILNVKMQKQRLSIYDMCIANLAFSLINEWIVSIGWFHTCQLNLLIDINA